MEQAPPIDQRAALPRHTNAVSLPFLRIQERRWLLGAVDTVAVAASLLGAYQIWRVWVHPARSNMGTVPWGWVLGGAFLWLAASWLAGAYELETADRLTSSLRAIVTVTAITGVGAFVAYYAFLKTYPRPALAVALISAPASVVLWRALYVAALSRPAMATRLLLVGNETLHRVLAEAAAKRQDHFRVLGFLAEHPSCDPLYLGSVVELSAVALATGAHRIVVSPRQSMPGPLISTLGECVERGMEVVDFNTAYEEIAGKVAVEHAGDFWLAALPTRPQTSSFEDLAMRLVDVCGAVVGLALTAVLGPIIVALIKLDSPGSAIYSQSRLGRAGKEFTIYKFRTMRRDAEQDGARWAVTGDQRTTRCGRLLRRMHLDELPQFWNVLRGDMSLVGPRPERPSFTDALSQEIPFYRLRLSVRPGLTGLKQIKFGYASTPADHLEVLRHDLYYIKHRSVALNLLIIWRTLGWVFHMRGR